MPPPQCSFEQRFHETKKFDKTKSSQVAFDILREKLLTAPVLNYPDTTTSVILTCDASDSAVGYVQGQIDENKRKYVTSYDGKSLSTDQRKFNNTEKECLAVLEGINAYRPYLVHSRFTVVTNHKPLVWLQTAKHTGRLERWALKLQYYNFQIIHQPGKSNCVANALSHREYLNKLSIKQKSIQSLSKPLLTQVVQVQSH